MNKEEALKKIKAHLDGVEPQVLTPKGVTYEDHVLFLTQKLMSEVISPIRVKVTSTIITGDAFAKYSGSDVWGIAKGKGGWLLTIEGESEFALGFGDNPNEIQLHGCSSSDVLAEWCA